MACPSATRYLGCELRQALQQLGSASASALLCLVAIIGSVNAGETTLASGEVKTTVTFNGRAVLPSHGSAAGVWAFLRSDTDPQMLLLGHPQTTSGPCYRAVLQLNEWRSCADYAFPVPDKTGHAPITGRGAFCRRLVLWRSGVACWKGLTRTGAQFCQARVAGSECDRIVLRRQSTVFPHCSLRSLRSGAPSHVRAGADGVEDGNGNRCDFP